MFLLSLHFFHLLISILILDLLGGLTGINFNRKLRITITIHPVDPFPLRENIHWADLQSNPPEIGLLLFTAATIEVDRHTWRRRRACDHQPAHVIIRKS